MGRGMFGLFRSHSSDYSDDYYYSDDSEYSDDEDYHDRRCSQHPNNLNRQNAYDRGLAAGRQEGFGQGHQWGYTQGQQVGYGQGRYAGYGQGRYVGYGQGRQMGYSQGRNRGYGDGYYAGRDNRESRGMARERAAYNKGRAGWSSRRAGEGRVSIPPSPPSPVRERRRITAGSRAGSVRRIGWR